MLHFLSLPAADRTLPPPYASAVGPLRCRDGVTLHGRRAAWSVAALRVFCRACRCPSLSLFVLGRLTARCAAVPMRLHYLS